jgi:hypothetical protein
MGQRYALCIVGLTAAALVIWNIRSSLRSGEASFFGTKFSRATSTGEFWFAIARIASVAVALLMLAVLVLFL